MLDFDPAEYDAGDSWRIVLEAYRSVESTLKQKQPESEGWLPRFRAVEGIEGEELSRVHGQLIAFGFLKFELAGREEGIRYQISHLGKRTLDRSSATSNQDDDSCDQDAEELSGAA